jgi:hypothetical protein
MAKRSDTATTEQLRHDIDSGRAGDKVRFRDPAAAPLGTDEEAAGTPIDPQTLAEVRARENRRAQPRDAQRATDGERTGVMLWLLIVAGVVVGISVGLLTL